MWRGSIEQVGSDYRAYFSGLDRIGHIIQTQIGREVPSTTTGWRLTWEQLQNDIRTDPSLGQLQAELARIDVLIERALRRWQLAGQDPTDAFRGLYVSDAEAAHLSQRPFGSNWGQTVELPEDEEDAFRGAAQEANAQARALQRGQPARLQNLVEAFGLDAFEKEVLLVCLAPALDLRYEKIYGYLQDDVTRKRPGVNLALDLLCPAGFERLLALSHFAADSPLFRYHLLERFSEPGQHQSPLLSQSLRIDETVVHWHAMLTEIFRIGF